MESRKRARRGTNWSLAYPGIRATRDSVQAAEWSRRLDKQMFKISLETDRFFLRLVFHSIRSRKVAEKLRRFAGSLPRFSEAIAGFSRKLKSVPQIAALT